MGRHGPGQWAAAPGKQVPPVRRAGERGGPAGRLPSCRLRQMHFWPRVSVLILPAALEVPGLTCAGVRPLAHPVGILAGIGPPCS